MSAQHVNRRSAPRAWGAAGLWWLIVPGLAGTLATACNDGPAGPDGPDLPAAVWAVVVHPDTLTLGIGEARTLDVRALARDSSVLQGRAASWSTSDTAIATVDAAGRVTGRSPGQATLTATIDGKQGQVGVRVQAPPPASVARIEIAPAGQLDIRSGSIRQLSVRAFAADGTELFGRTVVWRSSDPRIARVDSGHVLVASEMGLAAITATVEGRSAMLTIQVLSQVVRIELDQPWLATAPGEVVMAQAHPLDEDGNLLNKVVTWSSSAPAVATVAAPGRVTGVAPGSTIVTATVEGVSAQVEVAVGAWSERPLLTLDGAAPPALLFTVTRTDSVGTGQTTYVRALGGNLRMLAGPSGGGRYDQLFWVWIWRDGQGGDWGSLGFSGTYGNDSGALVFRSLNGEMLPALRLADGRIAISGTGTMTLAGKEVRSRMTFVYGLPE